jgi:hypothetical protein
MKFLAERKAPETLYATALSHCSRSKAYVTASDSEGVAADVAKYDGNRLYVAALSSFGDDHSDEDDEEGDVDSREDSEDEGPEDEVAGNESGSDGAEASEDKDEDLESGQVPSATRAVTQKRMKKEDTFTSHPTNLTKVIATCTVQKPNGAGSFRQVNEIPELQPAPTASTTGPAAICFFPPLASLKIPKKLNGVNWTQHPTEPDTYTRTDKTGITTTFKLTIILRAFDTVTHTYTKTYMNEAMAGVDPRAGLATKYNKWIFRIEERKDPAYNKVISRDPWIVAERVELYNCINEYCRSNRLPKFGPAKKETSLKMTELENWATRINAVGGKNRNKFAVRTQIFKAHEFKNKQIFDLLKHAEVQRAQKAQGLTVTNWTEQEFPQDAFPSSEFPTAEREKAVKAAAANDRQQKAGKNAMSETANKRKRGKSAAVVEDDSDEAEQEMADGDEEEDDVDLQVHPSKESRKADDNTTDAQRHEKTDAALEKMKDLIAAEDSDEGVEADNEGSDVDQESDIEDE